MPRKSHKKQTKDIFMPAQANPNYQLNKKSKTIADTNQKKGSKIRRKIKK
ncbi:hypothetical protein KJ855_00505 [Patescibacteria group bacterium]|nr:hypothetical protein [Patescibacteria group bacterium]